MFTKGQGPTRLKVDLVWAIAFSLADAEVPTDDGSVVAACAGMAALWNGRRGEVVVLIRHRESGEIDRYHWSEQLLELDDLNSAVDASQSFCESLGFLLDGSDFRGVEDEERRERLQRWEQLCKTASGRRAAGEAASRGRKAKRRSEEEADDESGDDDADRSVLARISLVRKEHGVDPGGRLRLFF